MNAKISKAVKTAMVAGMTAVALTGCCLWQDKKECCGECPKDKCCEQTSPGMNMGVSASVGTDGIKAGAEIK